MLTEFPKINPHMFTPPIAETHTKTILELDTEEKASEFIQKYLLIILRFLCLSNAIYFIEQVC